YAELADAGYVVCWLDVRGTGSSGGLATDEYSEAERHDLVAAVEWLATRDWSAGAVGMFGTSYGGFTSLQVALERPPALKAIVPIFASDDRYADDVHHFGGVLKQLDLVDYPTYMTAMNALPPVPQIWGEGWREEWDRRVDRFEPWVLPWIEHQRRDAYWRWGSTELPLAKADPGGMLSAAADGSDELAIRGDVGATAWISCAGVMPWVQPDDQRPDEDRSLTFTWEPLETELEILGHPLLRVRVTSSVPVAYLSAKVCDVFPDGSSSLVVRGLLNLTHRDSAEHPAPLTPGAAEEIELELEACSWTFEEGHRIRLD